MVEASMISTRIITSAFPARTEFSETTTSAERPGAVKGAPLLGAAKRTLDGEDRSARLEGERKARRRTNERWGKKKWPLRSAPPTQNNSSLAPGLGIPTSESGRPLPRLSCGPI